MRQENEVAGLDTQLNRAELPYLYVKNDIKHKTKGKIFCGVAVRNATFFID